MRQQAIKLAGAVLAIVLLAFSSGKTDNKFAKRWFPYDGSGAQTLASNYGSSFTPGCPGTGQFCAIMVDDANADNILQQTELNAALAALDPDSDGNIEEHGERANLSELKSPDFW